MLPAYPSLTAGLRNIQHSCLARCQTSCRKFRRDVLFCSILRVRCSGPGLHGGHEPAYGAPQAKRGVFARLTGRSRCLGTDRRAQVKAMSKRLGFKELLTYSMGHGCLYDLFHQRHAASAEPREENRHVGRDVELLTRQAPSVNEAEDIFRKLTESRSPRSSKATRTRGM